MRVGLPGRVRETVIAHADVAVVVLVVLALVGVAMLLSSGKGE